MLATFLPVEAAFGEAPDRHACGLVALWHLIDTNLSWDLSVLGDDACKEVGGWRPSHLSDVRDIQAFLVTLAIAKHLHRSALINRDLVIHYAGDELVVI